MLHPVPSALALALAAFLAAGPALADTATSAPATAPPSTSGDTEASNNFSIVRYRADYQVRPDAGNVQTETYEVLLKTKASVEQFSQVRLSYSEKMETLEVLGAYTITADGQRRDVPADRIYTQESYSSASAAMYADRKVRVIVFPNLAPGTRLFYQVRRTQATPYFPGYFGLWETFNVFTEYEDAEVTLSAPANLPMFVDSRGVQGSDRPTVKNGQAQWRWRYQRREAMPAQNWSAAGWEFGPNIMASTYRDWSQMGRAYQLKAGPAAQVTPELQALADEITAGISDRREQADALYRWVAQNIRYVAVYLGNGGLEPNSAQSILDNHCGDCKDHVTILEALLAAKGIDMPVTVFGDNPDDTVDLLSMLGPPPHVVKLNEGTQGRGVILTEKASASRGIVEALRGLYANFLMQEFIGEAKGADLRCFVVGDQVVASMQRQAPEGDFRSNLHAGGTAVAAKASRAEQQVAVRSAKALGLSVCGVDLIRSARGPLVLEVNSTPGLEGIEAACGVDVATRIIEHVEKIKKP